MGKYTEIAISLDDYIKYEEYQNVILELLNKEYNSIEEIIEQIPFDKEFYISNVDIKKENKLVYGYCENWVTNELYPNTTGYNDYYIDYIGKKKKNLIITPTHKKFGITVEHNLFDFIINRDLIFFFTKLFDEKILELSRNKKTAYVFIDEDILLIKNTQEIQYFLSLISYIYNKLIEYFEEVNFCVRDYLRRDTIFILDSSEDLKDTLFNKLKSECESIIYADDVEIDIRNTKLLHLGGKK